MSESSLHFIPASVEQQEAVRAFPSNDIMFITGCAGSGKTHLGLYLALREVIEKRAERIVLTRPTVPVAGEQLGFLPGKLEQKLGPWLLPIADCLKRMSHIKPDVFFKEHVEICPLAFMRGRTFTKAIALLDEAQNCNFAQLKLFLTRIGQRGKLIICGDPDQCDVRDSGLSDVISRLGGNADTAVSFPPPVSPPGLTFHHLPSDTSPRHPLIPHILNRLQ